MEETDKYSIKNGVLTVEDGVTELPRNPYANGGFGRGYFENNPEIVEAKLPSTLKSIGDWAFRRCKNLKKIEIPDSVTKLEHLVFAGCESLEEIVVPDSVSKMQTGDFTGCKKLKKAKLSKKVKEIQSETFSGCESLEEVSFSANLKSFEEKCFSGCGSLKELNIPKKVTNINSTAFTGCAGLERITVDEGNEYYHSPAGSNAILAGEKLVLGCKNTIIPEGTVTIDANAFSGCSGLKSISIPEGVTKIEYSAFENCSGLEEIYLPSTLETIGDDCFVGCYELKAIHVDKDNKAFNSGKNDRVLVNHGVLLYFVGTVIPAGEDFEEIGENAINKPGISELVIPEGVKKLGKLNFYTEESISIGESGRERIDYIEFPVKKLTIPSTVEEIEEDSFQLSESNWAVADIGEITVSDKNRYFDSRNGCNAIIDTQKNTLILGCKNTTIPEGVEVIKCRMISGSIIEKLTVPKSVRQIANLVCEIDELSILGEDVEIGEEWQSGYRYDPFETRNTVAKKVYASKSVIEKLKQSYEYITEVPEFIEL